MSDIRRLNLEESVKQEVSLVSVDKYKLGEQSLRDVEEVLPKLVRYPYWSPEFQAWEPLVTTYLTSGANPRLAEIWLPQLAAKHKPIGPREGPRSKIYASLLHMQRSHSSEAFPDYHWEEIIQFVNIIPKYIDNQKIILNYLYSRANYLELLRHAMYKSEGKPFSPSLMEAIYLYRHCMLEGNPATATDYDYLQSQIDAYVAIYSGTFESAASILPTNQDVYAWYTRDVKALICNAWMTALDCSTRRRVITAQDVMRMPVWLSERVTKYLQGLPCVMTSPVSAQFVFDALEYAFEPTATLSDPEMIYAFCIPRDYVKNLFVNLSEFYWSVREGRFIPYLISRVEAQYTSNERNTGKTPIEYRRELLQRGFPLEGT